MTDAVDLEGRVVDAIKTVYDPEIPVNIWELGLIYSIDIADDGAVGVKMTLTAPACPAAGELPGEVERAVRSVSGVTAATVDVVWEPAWNKDMMSDAAKLKLGFY